MTCLPIYARVLTFGATALHVFTTQRAELLTVLKSLACEAWSRAATVTGAGKVLVRTVLSYGQWIARHERPHIQQIERVVNTMRTTGESSA